ncbi:MULTISPECIES: hypothetical protein [Nocardia]|uniref:hypothetical protein n=1 Tax=Nocardia TaxID=1817 RepID=UPI000D69063D|nr:MULTISPECIES: hypothetical protein [Nocardia]
MTANYSLAPVAFDRRGNVLRCDVTDNYDTYGWVIAVTAGEAVRFLRGTGPGPATRSCGDNHKSGRAYRTVAHRYDGEGYRRVRPMFWTLSTNGVVHEVWSVTRKMPVFQHGTSVNRPDWADLRRAELDARRASTPPKEQPVTTIGVVFTPLSTETTFPARYYGTPLGINTVTWYQAVDRDSNADITGWTVSRNHVTDDFVINGPRGLIHSVASLAAAAEFISQSIGSQANS